MNAIASELGINDSFFWGSGCLFMDSLINKLSKQINAKKPVIFSYDESKELMMYVLNNEEMIFEYVDYIYSHYMICTGLIIYSDEIIQMTDYSTMLHVSSCGKEYYIKIDDLFNEMDITTNIVTEQ